jgi:hypothetical protein
MSKGLSRPQRSTSAITAASASGWVARKKIIAVSVKLVVSWPGMGGGQGQGVVVGRGVASRRRAAGRPTHRRPLPPRLPGVRASQATALSHPPQPQPRAPPPPRLTRQDCAVAVGHHVVRRHGLALAARAHHEVDRGALGGHAVLELVVHVLGRLVDFWEGGMGGGGAGCLGGVPRLEGGWLLCKLRERRRPPPGPAHPAARGLLATPPPPPPRRPRDPQ